MKKWRLLVIGFLAFSCIALGGCEKPGTAQSQTNIDETQIDNTTTGTVGEDVTDQYTGNENADGSSSGSSEAEITWHEETFSFEDDGGYKYQLGLKLSPIYTLPDERTLLDSAWNKIGGNNTLPITKTDWGIQAYNGGYYEKNFTYGLGGNRVWFKDMADILYYAVGTFTVKNVTDGWSLSSSNARDLRITLTPYFFEADQKESIVDKSNNSEAVVARIFYGNSPEDMTTAVHLRPSMSSDNWGPVPFVIGIAERKTPNEPDGIFGNRVDNIGYTLTSQYFHNEIQPF